MSHLDVCNLCSESVSYSQEVEQADVASDVRKFCSEKFSVWRCPACLSLHSRDPIDFDHYYQDYFLDQQEDDFVTKTIYSKYIKTFQKHGLKKEHHVLDFGCGNGRMVKALKNSGFTNAFGYDPFVQNYSDDAVLKNRYDFLISLEVIEHVEDTESYLRQVASFVKPGGRIVIATPNAEGIDLNRVDQFQWGLHQPFHRRILSKTVFPEIAGRCGLEPVELSLSNWNTLFPAINLRFIVEYIRANGNLADVAAEPARVSKVLLNPKLLFFAVYGYFFSPKTSMVGIFKKASDSTSGSGKEGRIHH